MMKKKVHFISPRLYNALNPVKIALIGVGGTGSHMLTCLSKINHALLQLEHAGLQVTVFDDDLVSESNIGRQLFSASEIGLNKGIALVNRINRFFGTGWKAQETKFPIKSLSNYDFIISCVDNVKTRLDISVEWKNTVNFKTPLYWMDFGNSKKTGQVILSSISNIKQPDSDQFEPISRLPLITEDYPTLLQQSEVADDAPSCSLAEALEKQDLFINPALANFGSSILWSMFREGIVDKRGCFMNLDSLVTQPIPVN
ncbi:PRTRC system ThiF family protein [Pedobacter jeongneungensis]|uniref:PRTRC system ThiF family protein n=1 Tax=Pedobacter jeongneungensis TaxID=947309 RepID=UPI0004694DC8|nr:PRTRC system ThiF family protein [Pedobacter jeongneungensis]